ncbi:MAG: hypothetical protein ABSG53_10295, partial [Thermoguttaceae bacterium]
MSEHLPNAAADIVTEAKQLWVEVSRRLTLALCAQEAVTAARLGNATLAHAVAEKLAALKRMDRGSLRTFLEGLANHRTALSNLLASQKQLRAALIAGKASKKAL